MGQKFLDIMEEIIPWDEWVEFVKPYYPSGKKRTSDKRNRKDVEDVLAASLVQSVRRRG